MKLYSYWQSTTSYRVRAALNLKGIPYEYVPVNLVSGDQSNAEYKALNPYGTVPLLILNDGTVLTQSLAIIEYLDAVYPDTQLIPGDPIKRAKVLAVAHGVAMDIHPVNNLRVVQALEADFSISDAQKAAWMVKWMSIGFAAIEAQLDGQTPFAFGTTPSIADICIVAQTYNAKRWNVPLQDFPKLAGVVDQALSIPEIQAAHPSHQPDAKEPT